MCVPLGRQLHSHPNITFRWGGSCTAGPGGGSETATPNIASVADAVLVGHQNDSQQFPFLALSRRGRIVFSILLAQCAQSAAALLPALLPVASNSEKLGNIDSLSRVIGIF